MTLSLLGLGLLLFAACALGYGAVAAVRFAVGRRAKRRRRLPSIPRGVLGERAPRDPVPRQERAAFDSRLHLAGTPTVRLATLEAWGAGPRLPPRPTPRLPRAQRALVRDVLLQEVRRGRRLLARLDAAAILPERWAQEAVASTRRAALTALAEHVPPRAGEPQRDYETRLEAWRREFRRRREA